MPEWIFYFVRQSSFREDAKASFAGTAGQLRVPSNFLESYTVPLAPTPEQHRIVAEIEKQFTRLDAGVAALKRAQANLKRYKASVLKAACEGRLVAQDPNDEPASELLARILERRKSTATKRKGAVTAPQHEPAPPDANGLPELPEGWIWVTLGQLSWDSGYGTSQKCDHEASGPPVIRIPNIINGGFDLNNLKYATKANELDEADALSPNDLLVVRTNGSKDLIGRTGLVRQPFDRPYFYASYLIRFRIIDVPHVAIWLSTIWDASINRRQIEQIASTSAGQYNVSVGSLSKLRFPLPPLAEQRRIVTEVKRRLSVVQEVEAVIAANLARAKRLRQSILKQAFAGRLVAQDSNDEPASVLLERIKAHRAGAALVALDARAGARPALTRRRT